MAFKMPRPIRRRDSQNAQFTQRIPTDLLEAAPGTLIALSLRPERVGEPPHLITARCGKTHVRVSLGTSSAKLAKERQAQVLAAISDHWAALRGKAPPAPAQLKLSPRKCAELAGEVYRQWQEGLQNDPALPPTDWQRISDEFAAIERGLGPRASQLIPSPLSPAYQDAIAEDMEDRTRSHVDAVLAAARLIIDAPSRRLLTQRVFEALKYNALQSARMAAGDFRPDPEAGRFPAAEKPLFKPPPKTFSDLFEEYALVNGKFGKRREKTLSRYRSIFTHKFANFIKGHCKHEDPLRVTRPDAAAWRNALKTEGLSDKTITDVMLACVRAIYARQIDDGFLEKNPADLRMPKPDNGGEEGSERPKGLTDAEAEAILKAARSFQPGKHGKALTTAIRWVPLITAATGARVTEICQARKEDFEQSADGWTLRITPEAGGVKNNRYRIVPLHSGLIALGLENFLANASAGPLFYNPPAPGEVSLASAQATGGKIAGWVRNDVGVTDKRVAPNHGWRHRLSTLCRLAGVHPEYREFLAGRAKRHQGEHYGDVAGLRREIERIKTSDIFPGCGL